jgi:hypothetical protein
MRVWFLIGAVLLIVCGVVRLPLVIVLPVLIILISSNFYHRLRSVISHVLVGPITNTLWVRAQLCRLEKKDALDSQPQVINFTSCFPMVGGSLRVLRLLPSLKFVDMI